MVVLQCGVTQRGAYFGNLPDFLALGAILVRTYLVPLSPTQKNLILIDRERCRLMVLFTIPTDVPLLQCTGVFWLRMPHVCQSFPEYYPLLTVVE